MQKISEKKRFSIIGRAKSFKHAFRGISILLKTQPNFWIHIIAGIIVVKLGLWLHISEGEWAILVLAIGIVLAAEAFNTAIEIDIDLTSPEYHPYARDTKDVAAGAVLITVIVAIVVGCIIFVPKLSLYY